MLQITNASKQFGQVQVLNQINLQIEANRIIGLVGPSGSGKSTLLRCIQQLETLDEGQIDIKGKCSFMFQDFQLFPHFNVINNLIYAPKINDPQGAHHSNAMALLTSLGIADKAQAFPHQLSGGQKQRVALARCLMMKPNVLLCDEPTSGLDMAAIDDVITLLHAVKKMQVLMIIASHDLDFLAQMVDRLLVIRNGHLIADFAKDQLPHPMTSIQQFYQGVLS